MSVKTSLYETDFYAWTQQQAALLRKNKWGELRGDGISGNQAVGCK